MIYLPHPQADRLSRPLPIFEKPIMPEATRTQVLECLERELEVLGNGEPIEGPDSNYRLSVFLVRDQRDKLQATRRRIGPDGQHDMEDFLAVVDVNLQSDEYLVAQCLQEFFDEEIPTDDNGGVRPDWPIDLDTLVEAHENAWERHCMQRIDEWVDDALAQMRAKHPSSS